MRKKGASCISLELEVIMLCSVFQSGCTHSNIITNNEQASLAEYTIQYTDESGIQTLNFKL